MPLLVPGESYWEQVRRFECALLENALREEGSIAAAARRLRIRR
jgi:hypothetical protein